MRAILALLILVVPALSGEPLTVPPATSIAPTPFPTDYRRSPCAATANVCQSFNRSQFADIAALRGFDLGQEWVEAHWDELQTALQPACERIATCFATPGNDHMFCNDIGTVEALGVCNRYPQGSVEREKCGFFINVFMAGVDRNSLPVWTELQACTQAQTGDTPSAHRVLKYWISPGTIHLDQTDPFTVYAVDSETGVAVQAKVLIESKTPIYAEDAPDGQPTTFYAVRWKPRLVRVPNASGHSDLVPPQIRIVAPGYREESFRLPMNVPRMKLTMSPPLAKWKRGTNRVTIKALDAATGSPVEARVMAGSTVLGKTNVPFELVLLPGQKRPEIWVTSLYERYSDVVVAAAKK